MPAKVVRALISMQELIDYYGSDCIQDKDEVEEVIVVEARIKKKYIYIYKYKGKYKYRYKVPPQDLFFCTFQLSARAFSSGFSLFSALSTRHHLTILTQSTPRKNLSQTLFRLKPIEPIEISIGTKIQDPRLVRGLSQGILDLGPD